MTREDAIKVLELMKEGFIAVQNGNSVMYGFGNYGVQAFDMAIEALECAPPKGRWLNVDGIPTKAQYAVYCSECTNWSEYASNYCMNCGADMRGEGDDE